MVMELQLVDFNDLFVIAIGISMTYIVVDARRRSTSFFGILSKMTKYVSAKILARKEKSQQAEEAVISRIKFYLESNLLEAETKGALKLVSDKANEVMNAIRDFDARMQKDIGFHTKTDFLGVISCDSFFFGLLVLFVGAFQRAGCVWVDGLIQMMLFFMAFLLVHCIIFEHIKINSTLLDWLKPRIFTHSIILIIGILCGISIGGLLPLDGYWLAISSIIACFIGFIAYFIMNLLANIVLFGIMLCRMHKLDIMTNAKSHSADIDRYGNELEKIDSQLKQIDFIKDINISAGSTNTQDE